MQQTIAQILPAHPGFRLGGMRVESLAEPRQQRGVFFPFQHHLVQKLFRQKFFFQRGQREHFGKSVNNHAAIYRRVAGSFKR